MWTAIYEIEKIFDDLDEVAEALIATKRKLHIDRDVFQKIGNALSMIGMEPAPGCPVAEARREAKK